MYYSQIVFSPCSVAFNIRKIPKFENINKYLYIRTKNVKNMQNLFSTIKHKIMINLRQYDLCGLNSLCVIVKK